MPLAEICAIQWDLWLYADATIDASAVRGADGGQATQDVRLGRSSAQGIDTGTRISAILAWAWDKCLVNVYTHAMSPQPSETLHACSIGIRNSHLG